MNREEQRHQEGTPQVAGRKIKEVEEQQGVPDVQDDVGQVIAPCIRTVDFKIDEIGQPGQWLPEARFECLKSPGQGLAGKSGLHRAVLRDVDVVIEIQELEGHDVAVKQRDGPHECEGQDSPRIEKPGQARGSLHDRVSTIRSICFSSDDARSSWGSRFSRPRRC